MRLFNFRNRTEDIDLTLKDKVFQALFEIKECSCECHTNPRASHVLPCCSKPSLRSVQEWGKLEE